MKKILLAILFALPNFSQAAELSSVAVTHVENGAGGSLNLVVGGKHVSIDCENVWKWKDVGHTDVLNITTEGGAPTVKYDGFETIDMKPPHSAFQQGVGGGCAKALAELKDNMSHSDGVAMYIGLDDIAMGVRPVFFLNTKYAKSVEDLRKIEEAFAGSDGN